MNCKLAVEVNDTNETFWNFCPVCGRGLEIDDTGTKFGDPEKDEHEDFDYYTSSHP